MGCCCCMSLCVTTCVVQRLTTCKAAFGWDEEGRHLLADAKAQKIEVLLDSLYTSRRVASSKLGSCKEAHEFAQQFVEIDGAVFKSREERQRLADEGLRYLDSAIQVSAPILQTSNFFLHSRSVFLHLFTWL